MVFKFNLHDNNFSFDLRSGTLIQLNSAHKLNLVVTLTTKCNLVCDYCFENHISRIHMKMQKVEEIIKAYDPLMGAEISRQLGGATIGHNAERKGYCRDCRFKKPATSVRTM